MNKKLMLFLVLGTILCATIGATSFASAADGDAGGGTTVVAPPPPGDFAKAISGVFGLYMEFLQKATSKIFSALQGSFQPFAFSLVSLYVVVVGYKLIRGDISASKDFAISCFLIVFVTSLVFNSGVYQSYIFDPFVGTVSDMSNFFVSKGAGVPIGSQGDIFNYMGSTLDSIYNVADKIERNLPLLDSLNIWLALKVGFAQLVLIGTYVACVAIYLYIILQAWFAVFIFMILGGIFIFLAAFKSSRHLTVGWLRALCHEGLTIVFASLIMGISGNITQELIKILASSDVGSTGIFTPQFFAVFLACAMGGLMLLKTPQLAASLSGGSAGSTAGIATLVGGAAGLGYSALKGGVGRVAGQSGGGGSLADTANSGSAGGYMGGAARAAGSAIRRGYSAMKGTSTGLS